jgi:hypothetical protein
MRRGLTVAVAVLSSAALIGIGLLITGGGYAAASAAVARCSHASLPSQQRLSTAACEEGACASCV